MKKILSVLVAITATLYSYIRLRILDRFGNLKKEWSYPPNSRRATINLSNLPQGVYFLKAFDGINWRTISFIKQ